MLTRAAVEAEIVDRIGPRMAFVGMPITTDGTNASLNGPIRRALVSMGFPTASPLQVSDADLTAFIPSPQTQPARDAWRVERLCDLACLQALESVLWKTTGDDVDWKAGVDEVKASQFVDAVRKDVERFEAKVKEPYGPDLPAALLGGMTPDPLRMPNDPFDPCRTRSRRGHWPYP